MSFFGKLYKKVRDENFDAYVDSMDIPEQSRTLMKKSSPETKLTKDADGSYTLTIQAPEYNKTLSFNLGVEFDEMAADKVLKTTFTMDGNTLTQVQKYGPITLTTKREYSDSDLKVTLTGSHWNGTAYRYYKA